MIDYVILSATPRFGLLPAAGSKYAGDVDSLFYFILWIAIIVLVVIASVMVLFAIKYRRKEGAPEYGDGATDGVHFQIIWGLIPLVLI